MACDLTGCASKAVLLQSRDRRSDRERKRKKKEICSQGQRILKQERRTERKTAPAAARSCRILADPTKEGESRGESQKEKGTRESRFSSSRASFKRQNTCASDERDRETLGAETIQYHSSSRGSLREPPDLPFSLSFPFHTHNADTRISIHIQSDIYIFRPPLTVRRRQRQNDRRTPT